MKTRLKLIFFLAATLAIFIPIVMVQAHGKKSTSGPAVASIADPYQLVWNQEQGNVSGMIRFQLDVNQDSIDDLFLAPKTSCTESGCHFHIFVVRDEAYQYVGTLPLNVATLKMLIRADQGFSNISTYWKTDEAAFWTTYRFDGEKYILDSTNDSGFIKVGYQVKTQALSPEDSGLNLSWKPEHQKLLAENRRSKNLSSNNN